MSLNNQGLGFTISADDAATDVIKSVMSSLNRLEQAADRAAADRSAKAKGFGGMFTEAADRAQRAGATVSAYGQQMMNFGQNMLGGLVEAGKEAARFETSLREVTSIASEAEFPLDKIEQIGRSMGMTYGGDVNKQVKTLYQAISSGANTAEEGISLMHAANKLAIGGLSDSFKAVDALTNVLNAYGMKMTESAAVSDAMFTTVRVGKTTVDELAHVIGRLAPSAKASGVSLDEMFAGVTAATQVMGNAHEAVTGLKAMLANIQDPAHDAQMEAAKLGIKFDFAAIKAKGFSQFLLDIVNSSKYTEKSMINLFGSIEARNVAFALAANKGKLLTDAMNEMKNKSGATEKAYNNLKNSAENALSRIKTGAQLLAVDLGQALAPAIALVMEGVRRLIAWFSGLSPETKRAIAYTLAFASGVFILFGAFAVLTGMLMGVLAVIKPMIIAATALSLSFVAIGVIVAGLALVFAGLKQAYEQNLGGFADFVQSVYRKIALAFDTLKALFTEGGFSEAIRNELMKPENTGVFEFVKTVWLWFNRLKEFFESVGKGFSRAMESMKEPIERLKQAFNGLLEVFGVVADQPGEAVKKFEAFGQAGMEVGLFLADVFKLFLNVLSAVMETVQGVWKAMSENGAFEALKRGFVTVKNAIVEALEILFGFGKEGETQKGNFIVFGEMIGTVFTVLAFVVRQVMDNVAAAIKQTAAFLHAMKTSLSGAVDYLKGFYYVFKGLFTGDMGAVIYGFKLMFYGLVEAVVGAVVSMLTAITSRIDALAAKIGKDLGLSKMVTGTADAALGGLKKLMGIDQPYKSPMATEEAKPATTGGDASVSDASTAVSDVSVSDTAQANAPRQVELNNTLEVENVLKLHVDGSELAAHLEKNKVMKTVRSIGMMPHFGGR